MGSVASGFRAVPENDFDIRVGLLSWLVQVKHCMHSVTTIDKKKKFTRLPVCYYFARLPPAIAAFTDKTIPPLRKTVRIRPQKTTMVTNTVTCLTGLTTLTKHGYKRDCHSVSERISTAEGNVVPLHAIVASVDYRKNSILLIAYTDNITFRRIRKFIDMFQKQEFLIKIRLHM